VYCAYWTRQTHKHTLSYCAAVRRGLVHSIGRRWGSDRGWLGPVRLRRRAAGALRLYGSHTICTLPLCDLRTNALACMAWASGVTPHVHTGLDQQASRLAPVGPRDIHRKSDLIPVVVKPPPLDDLFPAPPMGRQISGCCGALKFTSG
jgi:hypothetical protein